MYGGRLPATQASRGGVFCSIVKAPASRLRITFHQVQRRLGRITPNKDHPYFGPFDYRVPSRCARWSLQKLASAGHGRPLAAVSTEHSMRLSVPTSVQASRIPDDTHDMWDGTTPTPVETILAPLPADSPLRTRGAHRISSRGGLQVAEPAESPQQLQRITGRLPGLVTGLVSQAEIVLALLRSHCGWAFEAFWKLS